MNATDLLDELRPPLDTTPADPLTLERILRARPEPQPSRTGRYRRPLAVAGAAALVATGAVALVPSGGGGPVSIARAAAELARPDVLLHFAVTTTYASGTSETIRTWQTPDGRASHQILGSGLETAYDQRGRVYESYVPERDEILAQTDPGFFKDEADPFGSVVNGNRSQIGDLPTLLERALSGTDPNVRHVGRTTVRGVDVDQIRVQVDTDALLARLRAGAGVADVPASPAPTTPAERAEAFRQLREAPAKTVSVVRDVYVRHDNALPVRVVEHPATAAGIVGSTSDFADVQKLTLDKTTRPLLTLDEHPTAERTVRPPFDDSRADGEAGARARG